MINLIKITNFRSIKSLIIEPHNLAALIGPNSTGKTNILKAIDLVLGEGWTTKAKVAKELFNDPTLNLKIVIGFQQPISFTNNRGFKTSISTIELEMGLIPGLSAKTTINDGQTFYDQEYFKKLCHFIYIPSERHLSNELRVSQWTMLGKLMKLIYENYQTYFQNDSNKLKEAFAKEIQPAKNFLEADFSDTGITFKKFSDTFKKYCCTNSAGLANSFEPVLNIYNMNWFYKTLQIHIQEDNPDLHFDSEEVGSGMQNLLMLSIFQTYAELMDGKVIFGIEEPEIYLYPQAQRSLYRNFIELSKHTQIFYTTHNPNFVDAARPDDILLLRKNIETGTYPLIKNTSFNNTDAEKIFHKIYTHFNSERNELFFAKKILLVEGSSDKILFSTLSMEKWKIDIDKEGISVVECGGKGGVIYFIGVCRLIGITDFFAVWDKDKDADDKFNNLTYALSETKGLELDPNLETLLKLSTNTDAQKVKNAYTWAINIDLSQIPKHFDIVKTFLKPKEIEKPTNTSEGYSTESLPSLFDGKGDEI